MASAAQKLLLLFGGAPPTVSFSGSLTVAENAAIGTVVGTFIVIGGSGVYTFAFATGGNPGDDFALNGDEIETAAALDFETTTSYALVVEADNGVDPVLTFNATVTVTDVDDTAPTITSTNTASVAENATLSKALTANESVTWSIVGGADQARLEISGSTLRWLSNGTKDYEAPNDADTNNTYVVDVRATDAALNTTDQTITVTVTDVSEGRQAMFNGIYAVMGATRQFMTPAGYIVEG